MALLLTPAEIQEKIKQAAKSKTLAKAKENQKRINFHVTPETNREKVAYRKEFLTWVASILPKSKYKTFEKIFTTPVKTVEITQAIFDKLSRIFEGRNPIFSYNFSKPNLNEDWAYYRDSVLKVNQIWQTDGWENFKTNINSVLVVDLPSEDEEKAQQDDTRKSTGSTKFAAPYFYWVGADRIIDYELNPRNGDFDFIVFKQGENRVIAIDGGHYRVFEVDKGQVKGLISESEHKLGYCPARFFWNDAVDLNEPHIKQSPITKILGALDWYLFFHTSKKHLDLYGAYPIISGYATSCDFRTEGGRSCSNGFTVVNGVHEVDQTGQPVPCPKCGESRLAGPGTFVKVRQPMTKDQPDLAANPIKLHFADTGSLDYNVSEESRLRKSLIESVVGLEGQALNTEALNETQVGAAFENQIIVLNRIKKGFEEAWTFVDDTLCRLRYGSEVYSSCVVNLGTEFYEANSNGLRIRYKEAKEEGASESELMAFRRQIIETDFRHDRDQLARMLLLLDLEPYPNMVKSETLALVKDGYISSEMFGLKLNFTNFVAKFERENGNITDFGIKMEYPKRLEKILETFKNYLKENEASTNNG